MNKKGQLAIFVIVAIIIVAAILIFFFIYRNPVIQIGGEFNPENFLDTCLRNSIQETVEVALPKGGFVSPEDFKIYNGIEVAYLCKNVNYYETCITQYPLYVSQIEEEIEINIKDEIESCFILLEEELDNRNYEHSGGDVSIDVTLKPGVVEATVFRDFSFSKGGFTSNFDSFTVGFNSELYDIAIVANEIVSQEAKFCYFEYVGFDVLYPKFDVRKTTMSDSTKIYSIEEKETGDEMNIAIRGCVIPAGF